MLNSSLSHAEAVNTLLKFTSKAEMLTIFQEEAFYEYVDRIVVYSRKEVGFELKCGLTLREGLVR